MKIINILKHLIPFHYSYISFRKSVLFGGTFSEYLKFRLGLSNIYWPKDKTCLVSNPKNIFVGMNCGIGRPGSYIQGGGGVYIGDYVLFGPNVGILSSNHDLYDRRISNNKPIKIGNYSWIGMHSVVLAGVELGPFTTVGAGSVVTKSFPEGYVVIGGNPAKVIKTLDKNIVKPYKYEKEYYGFIPKNKFKKMRDRYIGKFIDV